MLSSLSRSIKMSEDPGTAPSRNLLPEGSALSMARGSTLPVLMLIGTQAKRFCGEQQGKAQQAAKENQHGWIL
jgi:hypothetical protein